MTSREALRAAGEHVHVLSSLENPPENANITAAEALRYPATQLFMERAAAAGYQAHLSEPDAAALSTICRKLDGIPLAIELAAGAQDHMEFGERRNTWTIALILSGKRAPHRAAQIPNPELNARLELKTTFRA